MKTNIYGTDDKDETLIVTANLFFCLLENKLILSNHSKIQIIKNNKKIIKNLISKKIFEIIKKIWQCRPNKCLCVTSNYQFFWKIVKSNKIRLSVVKEGRFVLGCLGQKPPFSETFFSLWTWSWKQIYSKYKKGSKTWNLTLFMAVFAVVKMNYKDQNWSVWQNWCQDNL